MMRKRHRIIARTFTDATTYHAKLIYFHMMPGASAHAIPRRRHWHIDDYIAEEVKPPRHQLHDEA